MSQSSTMGQTAQRGQKSGNQNLTSGKEKSGEREKIDMFGDFCDYSTNYMREQPETAALILVGIGFILGWKMKMW